MLGDRSMVISEEDEEEASAIQSPIQEHSVAQAEKNQSIVVEARFCTVCNIEQPLRAKHCRDCDSCVALHDHHCPWVGVCIGEKNRRPFWWFLFFQGSLLWLSSYLVISSFWNENSSTWVIGLKALGCFVIGFFCLMVTTMLSFHTIMAFRNQTTWETASWAKISYLKEWPRNYHSPFSGGAAANLHFFCCKNVKESHTLWVMPSTLPDQEPHCWNC